MKWPATNPSSICGRSDKTDFLDHLATVFAEREVDELLRFTRRLAIRVIKCRTRVGVLLREDRFLAYGRAVDGQRLDRRLVDVRQADVTDACGILRHFRDDLLVARHL